MKITSLNVDMKSANDERWKEYRGAAEMPRFEKKIYIGQFVVFKYG